MKPVFAFVHRARARARSSTAPAVLLACVLSTACAGTPPVRWHSLLAGGEGTARHAAAESAAPALWFDVAPVRVPAQVDRAQLVVGLGDGVLAVLEQQRWSSSLAEELRDALAERLAQRTGGIDAGRLGMPAQPARTVWRVQLELLRFDTTPGADIVQHAAWAVHAGEPAGPGLTCRSRLQASAGSDTASAVAAHRQALAQLAERIAQALLALDRGAAAACAPAS